MTSITVSTYTVFSVYASDSAVASSSLSVDSSRYNFQPPFTATYLSASVDATTEATASAAPTATSVAAGDGSSDDVTTGVDPAVANTPGSSATGLSVSGPGVLAAFLVTAIGGLAFGL